MTLENNLRRWVAAGLIEEEQAAGIAAFERQASRPLFLYAVAGLGGLAIAIGIVSIVAANWDAIPGRLKIAVDLLLVAGLGYGVVHWHRRGPSWARETSILVLYGLIIASIALVGQVYQLGGKAHAALGVWTLLTAMLMVSGRSATLALTWLIGLQTTYATWLIWAAEDPWDLEELMLAAIYWAPLLTLVVGLLAPVRRARPQLASVFETVGWSEIVFCATLGTFAFYGDTASENWNGVWLGMAISGVITAWLWTLMPNTPGGRSARWLLVVCLALSHLPLLLSTGDLDVVAALTFIGLWFLVALTAHRSGRTRLLNLATAVIGVRILVVYFEVFGSLLGTGIGLVTGGLLTLGLMWLWLRSRRRFERRSAVENPQ